MLFMLKAKHNAEKLPVSLIRQNPHFVQTPEAQTAKSNLKVIGSYGNAPSRTLWFVVEAQTLEELNTFALPFSKIGEVDVTPVQTMEALAQSVE